MRESACSRWDSHGLWWFQGNCTRRRQSIFEPVLAIKNSDVLSKRNKLKSDLEYEVVNNPGGHKSPHGLQGQLGEHFSVGTPPSLGHLCYLCFDPSRRSAGYTSLLSTQKIQKIVRIWYLMLVRWFFPLFSSFPVLFGIFWVCQAATLWSSLPLEERQLGGATSRF